MSHPMQAHPSAGQYVPQYPSHTVASTSTSQAITNTKPRVAKEKPVQIPLPQEVIDDAELSLLRHPNLKGDLNQALLRTADQVAPGVKLDPDAEELLLYMTGDFLSNLVNFSCRIASHKGGGQVAPEDVALYLERVINMPIQLDRPPPAPRPAPAQKRQVREEEEDDEDEDEEEEEEPTSNIGERLRTRHARSTSTASKPSAPPARKRPRRGTVTRSAPVVDEPSEDDDEEEEDEEGDEEGDENDEEQQEGEEGGEGEGDEDEESEEEEAQPRESQRLKEKAKAAKSRGRGRGKRGSRGRT